MLAQAIELGEPQVESWLGERIDVLVPVELGELEPQRVQARLLSASEYDELQLAPAHPFLKHVTAGWSEAAGPLTIRIRSQRPNPEPLLTVAVEVVTPSLRVIRHVSLLFDPRAPNARPAERARAADPASQTVTLRPAPPTPRAPAAANAARATKPPPKTVAPPRPAAAKTSVEPRAAPANTAAALPRFQLTYSLREFPPLTTPQPLADPSFGALSTALTQHGANVAAVTSPEPQASVATAVRRPTTPAASTRPPIEGSPPAGTPATAGRPADALAPPGTENSGAASIGRIIWALIPAVLAVLLWLLLRQRIRPASPSHAAQTTVSAATKVTPINAGRSAKEPSAPTLRAANE